MEDQDVYMLASRLNGKEQLVLLREGGKIGPNSFFRLKEARDLFKDAYQVLTNLPPTDMALYTRYFEQMAVIYPGDHQNKRTDFDEYYR